MDTKYDTANLQRFGRYITVFRILLAICFASLRRGLSTAGLYKMMGGSDLGVAGEVYNGVQGAKETRGDRTEESVRHCRAFEIARIRLAIQTSGTCATTSSPWWHSINFSSRRTLNHTGTRTANMGISIISRLMPIMRCGRFGKTQIMLFLVFVAFILSIAAAQQPTAAQVATFTETNIGSPTPSGDYSFISSSPDKYQVDGGGTGIGGTTDSFFFASTIMHGNTEIIAKLTALQPPAGGTPNNYAQAGLMFRDGLGPDAAHAFLSVSPANGVNFVARTVTGGASTVTLGPTKDVPTYVLWNNAFWLRLVRSGTTIAGYISDDGTNWKLVGQTNITFSSENYRAGLAASSNTTSALIRSEYQYVNLLASVPQRTANLLLWLRGDAGVQYSQSTNQVSAWSDQSLYGNDAKQATFGNQPTFAAAGAFNNLPGVNFDAASADFMQVPTTASTAFAQGVTMFVVVSPTGMVSNARVIDFGNSGTATDSVGLLEGTSQPRFFCATGTFTYADGPTEIPGLPIQVWEGQQSGTSATGYLNGMAGNANNSMNVINSVARTQNNIGRSHASPFNYLNGKIFEVLVFTQTLSKVDRQAVENYLIGKYRISSGALPQLAPPAISPP